MQATRTWFTCKVKYYKPVEGTDKIAKVSEAFLVNALTFTEAEAIITHKCKQFVIGDFFVDGIAKANLSEVVPFEGSEDWYKIKISFLMEDEKTGKEKPVSHFSLLQANSVKDAFDKMSELLSGSIHPFVIPSIGITKIMEVFPYDEGDTLRAEGYVPVSEAKATNLENNESFDTPVNQTPLAPEESDTSEDVEETDDLPANVEEDKIEE
ncbi:MAG: DUF4494 domain-containing protein [Flavobacteriales bacterium]|nr:DUF4494 domain-containing protein [Flavobacteriales bacterium]